MVQYGSGLAEDASPIFRQWWIREEHRAVEKRSHLEHWIVALHARVGYHKTLVAIANKHARILWAILAKGEHYDPNAWQRYAPVRH